MGSLHADRASRGKEVLGADDVARSLTRIAYEIIERNGGSDNLVIRHSDARRHPRAQACRQDSQGV